MARSVYSDLDNEAQVFQSVLRKLEQKHSNLIGRMRAKEAYMESLIAWHTQKDRRLQQELENQGIKVVVYRNHKHAYWDVNTVSGHGLAVVEFNRENGAEFLANETCAEGDECLEIHFGNVPQKPLEFSYLGTKAYMIEEFDKDAERKAEILIYQLYDVRKEQVRWYDDA